MADYKVGDTVPGKGGAVYRFKGGDPKDKSNWEPVQAPAAQPDDGFSFAQMLKNVPSSAASFAGNIWDAATSPVQTAKGVGSLLAGAGQKAGGALQRTGLSPEDVVSISPALGGLMGVSQFVDDKTPAVDSFVEAQKGRYGSIDKALNTLESDPVGVLADASMLAAPVAKVAGLLNPAAVPAKAAALATKALPKSTPSRLYERAAKFSTTLDDVERARITETALSYGLLPTSAGLGKLDKLLRTFNNGVDDLIKSADDAGKTIPRSAVYKHINTLRKEAGGLNIDAPGDLAAINKIVGGFEDYAKGALPNRLSASQLQAFKKSLYEKINWDARRMTGTPIREQTLKTAARGAKEGVEQLVPGVRDLNAKLGDLYELQPHLQRSANRIANRQVVPLTAPLEVGVGAGVGGLLGGPPGAALGGGAGALVAAGGHPLVSPRLALLIRKQQEARMLDLLSRQGAGARGLLYAGEADRLTDRQP